MNVGFRKTAVDKILKRYLYPNGIQKRDSRCRLASVRVLRKLAHRTYVYIGSSQNQPQGRGKSFFEFRHRKCICFTNICSQSVDLRRPVVVFQDRIYLTAVCVDQLYTLGINRLIRVGVYSVKVVKRFRKISIEQSEKIDSVDK